MNRQLSCAGCIISERKIDALESRLAGVEHVLQRIDASLSIQTTGERVVSSGSVFSLPKDRKASFAARDGEGKGDGAGPVFEGDSSLTAHTSFVNDFVDRAVRRAPLPETDPGMQSALSALRQIVQRQNKRPIGNGMHFPNQEPLPKGGFRNLSMPPTSLVCSLISRWT